MTPSESDLWFLPLGGCGEIGMNLNLYGHAGKWLMVDCGVTFEKRGAINIVQTADPSFIAERKDQLVGLVVTHAHQDHLGGIHLLWEQLECPIFASPFTRHVLQSKLRRERCGAPVVEILPGENLNLSPFHLEWLPVTHSTIESSALVISTEAGKVLHTADWKIDPNPVVGEAFDKDLWHSKLSEPVKAIVCDSTNATRPGHSLSEEELYEGLDKAVARSKGRVVVGCFASNIARLDTLATIAKKNGRYLTVLGRSLKEMVRSAKATGYLDDEFETISSRDLGFLPPEDVMIIATGSQGEPNAALEKLASLCHRDIDLSSGDTIIFSSKTIPGNEKPIAQLKAKFRSLGCEIVDEDNTELPIHASGHPCQSELEEMYAMVDAEIAIPVHGEPVHLEANAALAREAGIKRQLIGSNGDLFRLAPQISIKRGVANASRLEQNEDGELVTCPIN